MILLLRAVALGLLQAVTEIFPFSNTAHIIFLQRFFHYRQSYLAYDVVIDAALLLAIFIFYTRDVICLIRQAPLLLRIPFTRNRNEIFWDHSHVLTLSLILVSCTATYICRFIFYDAGSAISNSITGLGVMWLVMGAFLLGSKKLRAGQRTAFEMNHQDAFVIGLAQGLTVFAGISRPGITIFFALFLGIESKEAVRYSFLLAIPYLMSSLGYKIFRGVHLYQSDPTALLVSFVTTLIAGIFVLALLRRVVESGKFYRCAYYCFAAGIFAVFYSFFPNMGF